jgi:XRE family transcriptional regulator, regulator of sulfur utilization
MGRRHEPQEALGRAIRQLRSERGIRQRDLAQAADMNVTAISHIERGRANPAWGTVKRIATALGVPVSEVAARAERLADVD